MCILNLINFFPNFCDYLDSIYTHYQLFNNRNPGFTCHITTCEKIYKVNSEKIKFHNKIRYIYFPSSQFLENYIFGKTGKVIINISKHDNSKECNCEINIEDLFYSDNIVDGESVSELCITDSNFSIILRIPKNKKSNFKHKKGYIILRYNRDNIELY